MITAVPANEASWADIQTVFGARGDAATCQCQRYKVVDTWWRNLSTEERTHRFREQTDAGQPDAAATTGLLAYRDGEPVAWCGVEPRPAYPRLAKSPVPWTGRYEDRADDSVWSVICFFVRVGHRRQGLMYALAAAAVDYARDRGAAALEAYPMITEPGREITWGELHVGARQAFAAAGFTQVSHPTKRRVVMRIDF